MTENNEKWINSLLNARNNIVKMMDYRGYNISKIPFISTKEIEIFEDIKNEKKKKVNPFDMVFEKNDNILEVKFQFSKLTEKKLEEYITKFFEENDCSVTSLIIIIKDKDMDNILQSKAYQLYQVYKYFTQIFTIDSLQQNIMEHSFVPNHILLNDEEEKKILQNYNLESKRKLPYIIKYDPVAKYIGMKPGNVCKIIRASETAGEYISYRYCV